MSDNTLIVIDDFKVDFDLETIGAQMGGRRSARADKILSRLAEEASSLARPVAGAKLSAVTELAEDTARLDGTDFSSSLLREKLEGLGRAFPYLASEGRELAEWAQGFGGTDRIFADALERAALVQVRDCLEKTILDQFGLSQISAMNPGSLRIWPITEQVPLFGLLRPLPERLGISLLPSFMMEPRHTVSGLFFQTDTKFHNCQLCPKVDCTNRKAPYSG